MEQKTAFFSEARYGSLWGRCCIEKQSFICAGCLETIYKQKNEGGDNTKSGDIPLDLMDVLFATALAISPSESLIKRATGIFDVALLLTDDNDLGNDEDDNINTIII